MLILVLGVPGWSQALEEAGADKLLLKLPVRVMSRETAPGTGGSEMLRNLKQDNFSLLINGQPFRMADFFARSRSLAAGRTVRYFILGIHGKKYPGELALGVSHFVRNVLKPTDQLVVWTPLKLYRMDISGVTDKDQILLHIEKAAQKDIAAFNKARDKQTAILADWLKNTEKKLKKGGQATISPVMFFLKHYDYEWRQYREKFILANLAQYTVIASLASQAQGEKYLVHFQEKEVIPYENKFLELKEKIKTYAKTLPKSSKKRVEFINKSLDQLTGLMTFSDDPVPVGDILNGLMGINLNYNLIFYKPGGDKRKNQPELSTSPRCEKILRQISRQTGGKVIETENTVEAVNALVKHVDMYYELVFPFDGNLEDKRVAVQLTLPGSPPDVDIYHKNIFKKEELKFLKQWAGTAVVGIFDYSYKEGRLSFRISGFQKVLVKGKPPETGLVEVKIQLINDKRETVYDTGNTLKSTKDSINVSLKLPDKHKGYFKLSIKVKDQVSKKEAKLNKYIKINPKKAPL